MRRHLGHRPGYHPTYRGFDSYVGDMFSVDMGCVDVPGANIPAQTPCPTTGPGGPPPDTGTPALPLYNSTGPSCSGHSSCNADIAAQPLDLHTLSDTYAGAADSFLARHAAGTGAAPFLLYVAFGHMHVPLAHAPRWTNTSARKTIFGDTLMELDATVGAIMASLSSHGLDDSTLVLMTGDNGPWEVKCDLAGSKGPWVGAYQASLGGGGSGKNSIWEGGHREFGVAVWPGKIPAGTVSHATASTLDIVPTVAALAGVALPADRVYDGFDLSPVLFDGAPSVREWLAHPNAYDGNISVIRYQNYTAVFESWGPPTCTEPASPTLRHNPPIIFDLGSDPGQTTPLSPPPPGLVSSFLSAWTALQANITGTFRSITNYSKEIGVEPCCDPARAVCRCEG